MSVGKPRRTCRTFPVSLSGGLEPFFTHANVELEYQQQTLLGKDGLGRDRWRAPLRDSTQGTFFVNPNSSHARVSGHLLLVTTGFQVLAIDTLGGSSRESARVLWRQDLLDNLAAMGNIGLQQQIVNVPWAPQRMIAADALGRPIGNIGPITAEVACFQRQRNVHAVRPLTGETLWTRATFSPAATSLVTTRCCSSSTPTAARRWSCGRWTGTSWAADRFRPRCSG